MDVNDVDNDIEYDEEYDEYHDEGNGENKGSRITVKQRIIRFFILIVALAIFALVAMSLIQGPAWVIELLSLRSSEITVEEFNFDAGRSRIFAKMNNSIASAGTAGINVVDFGGRETLRDTFRMTQPSISSNGNRSIAFDIGGSAVRVFSESQIISSLETYGTIVSATLNNSGWFCVVTQEGGGSRGTVSVHNAAGHEVYRVDMRTGFPLTAVLSPNNTNLAILNFSETGSNINFYHGIDDYKSEPDLIFDIYGGLIIDIVFLTNNNLLVISTDSLFTVDRSGSATMLYSFPGQRLGGFVHCGNFIALHLYDYGIGLQGNLVTLNTNGTILGELAINREILSMSAINNSLVILLSEGVVFFNRNLDVFQASADSLSAAGSSRVLALSNDTALATNDNTAIVIRRGEH